MRALIQRVANADVVIENRVKGTIGKGLLVLLGIENEDHQADVEWLSKKIVQLRIFDDAHHIPNLSVKDIDGDILLVSQFTLHAMVKKGNRPSYIRAARPGVAVPLYEKMIGQLRSELGKPIETGIFGADMKVRLVNDGPLTIWIDTKAKE